jgi:hypothetical protein
MPDGNTLIHHILMYWHLYSDTNQYLNYNYEATH